MNVRFNYNGKKYDFKNIPDDTTDEQLMSMADSQEEDKKKSPAGYLKGLATSVFNGATGNLGNRVYGALTAGGRNYAQNEGMRGAAALSMMGGKDKAEQYAKAVEDENAAQSYDDVYENAKDEYTDVNESFAKNFPKSNFFGELGGIAAVPVPGAVGVKAATKSLKGLKWLGQVAKRGATVGAGYGALHGAADSQDLASLDALRNAASGAGWGAVTGGGLSAVGGIIGTAFKGFGGRRKQIKNFVDTLEKNMGKKFNDAINTNTPIIEVADRKTLAQANKYLLNSPEGREVFQNYIPKATEKQVQNMTNMANENFGNKMSNAYKQELENEASKIYNPLYEKINNEGKGIKLNTRIPVGEQTNKYVDIYQDPLIVSSRQSWLNKYKGKYDDIPLDNSITFQGIREDLDAQISRAFQQNENKLAYDLMESRNRINNLMKSQIPEQVIADKSYSDMMRRIEAVDKGTKVANMNAEEIAEFKNYLAENPQLLKDVKAGMRGYIENRRLATKKGKTSNVAGKTFDDQFLDNAKEIGIDIRKEADKLSKSIENVQYLTGNSLTAERITDADAPKAVGDYGTYVRAMTNPKMLKKLRDVANKKTVKDEVMNYISTNDKVAPMLIQREISEANKRNSRYSDNKRKYGGETDTFDFIIPCFILIIICIKTYRISKRLFIRKKDRQQGSHVT